MQQQPAALIDLTELLEVSPAQHPAPAAPTAGAAAPAEQAADLSKFSNREKEELRRQFSEAELDAALKAKDRAKARNAPNLTGVPQCGECSRCMFRGTQRQQCLLNGIAVWLPEGVPILDAGGSNVAWSAALQEYRSDSKKGGVVAAPAAAVMGPAHGGVAGRGGAGAGRNGGRGGGRGVAAAGAGGGQPATGHQAATGLHQQQHQQQQPQQQLQQLPALPAHRGLVKMLKAARIPMNTGTWIALADMPAAIQHEVAHGAAQRTCSTCPPTAGSKTTHPGSAVSHVQMVTGPAGPELGERVIVKFTCGTLALY